MLLIAYFEFEQSLQTFMRLEKLFWFCLTDLSCLTLRYCFSFSYCLLAFSMPLDCTSLHTFFIFYVLSAFVRCTFFLVLFAMPSDCTSFQLFCFSALSFDLWWSYFTVPLVRTSFQLILRFCFSLAWLTVPLDCTSFS